VLGEVSDPDSPRRGEYLSKAAVEELVRNPAGTAAVKAWLQSVGATVTRETPAGEYLVAEARISDWEAAFSTRFQVFQHRRDGVSTVRCLNYTLEAGVAEHVEGVLRTVHLPFRPLRVPSAAFNEALSLTTPAKLLEFYKVQSQPTHPDVRQSVYEASTATSDSRWSAEDLVRFQNEYGLSKVQVAEDYGCSMDNSACTNDADSCQEPNLDIQYMTAVSQNSQTVWYDSHNDFSGWLLQVLTDSDPPLVHSISYGIPELDAESGFKTLIPNTLAKSFNTEAKKLGARGITIVVSSGDDGAPGAFAREIGAGACHYNPSFPATSPYVTAVGGTMGVEDGGPEITCSSTSNGLITSGGGYSTLYEMPDYQRDAAAAYGETTEGQKVSSGFSSGRGIPDLSMAAHNYMIFVGGTRGVVSGTSASAPVFAAMLSLVNAQLANQGKAPVGFVNPTLYKAAVAGDGSNPFNDITSGDNLCTAGQPTINPPQCCPQGFYAAPGWDPATGLGSWNHEIGRHLFKTKDGAYPPPWGWWEVALIVIASSVACVALVWIVARCLCGCDRVTRRQRLARFGITNTGSTQFGLFLLGGAWIAFGIITAPKGECAYSATWNWTNSAAVAGGSCLILCAVLLRLRAMVLKHRQADQRQAFLQNDHGQQMAASRSDPPTTVRITVPEGLNPGDEIEFVTPQGQRVRTIIPPGTVAGGVFDAQVPVMARV